MATSVKKDAKIKMAANLKMASYVTMDAMIKRGAE